MKEEAMKVILYVILGIAVYMSMHWMPEWSEICLIERDPFFEDLKTQDIEFMQKGFSNDAQLFELIIRDVQDGIVPVSTYQQFLEISSLRKSTYLDLSQIYDHLSEKNVPEAAGGVMTELYQLANDIQDYNALFQKAFAPDLEVAYLHELTPLHEQSLDIHNTLIYLQISLIAYNSSEKCVEHSERLNSLDELP